jgi:hypothetical protein
MMLGLGGLQRERPVETARFTLTLPVTSYAPGDKSTGRGKIGRKFPNQTLW